MLSASADALHRFLGLLDPDPERAGAIYRRLHLKLQFFFEGHFRTAHHAPELADESIDRMIGKMGSELDLAPREIQTYLLGIARFVLKEQQRKRRFETLDFEPMDLQVPIDELLDGDLRRDCLDRCLAQLPAEEQRIIVDYYAYEKREKIEAHRGTATNWGHSGGALRVKVFRIRRSLEKCIRKCCETRRRPTGTGPGEMPKRMEA